MRSALIGTADLLTKREQSVLEDLRRYCRDVEVALFFDSAGRYRIEGKKHGEVVIGVTFASLSLGRRKFDEAYTKAMKAGLLAQVTDLV